VAHHSHLPALAKDTHRVAAALKPALGDHVRLESCELLKIAPLGGDSAGAGAGLVASYKVTLHDTRRAGRVVQFYCGHVRPDAGALFRFWRERELAPVAIGDPLVYAPELEAVLFAFPNDPELPHLADCFSIDALHECLRHWPNLREGRLLDFGVTPLKHDPGRGCLCRITMCIDLDGVRRTCEVLAKTHKSDRLARTFATMTRLREAPAFRSGSCLVPQPIFYDAERRVLWQEVLPGKSFWSLYPHLDVTMVFREMAGVAASLHASRFAPPGRSATAIPDSRSDALGEILPDLRNRRATLMQRLRDAHESLGPVEPVSLHGDFHPDQFLIDGDRIGLTDFDSSGWGDPAYDAGRFASHVILKALQRDLALESLAGSLEAFFDEYLRRAPIRVSHARICWQTAAQLLGRRVHKVIRQETGSPRQKAERMLLLAEAYLDRCRV
jgi:hypothetical protein